MRVYTLLVAAGTVVTGCNFVTNNYTLQGAGGGEQNATSAGTGGTGGTGGSADACTVVFRDPFDEPLTVNWVVTGDPELLEGQVELGGTDFEKLESRDTFDFQTGGCVTLKIDELSLPADDDRGILFLTNPGFSANFTMTGNGRGELNGGDASSASVLTGLREPGGALRGHWRICIDTSGLAHYFASVDGAIYTELDDREERYADWDVTDTVVAFEAVTTMGSTTTMTVDWLEVCVGYAATSE